MNKQQRLLDKEKQQQPPNGSAEQAASAIYQDGANLQGLAIPRITEKVKLTPVDIGCIFPDPVQPRRLIPKAVHQSRVYGPDNIRDIFERWFQLYVELTGTPLDLENYLDNPPPELDDLTPTDEERTDVDPDHPAAVVTSLLGLVRLAASIKHHGLTYNLTVYATH